MKSTENVILNSCHEDTDTTNFLNKYRNRYNYSIMGRDATRIALDGMLEGLLSTSLADGLTSSLNNLI